MATDRTGWTPLQIARADHSTGEGAVHDLRNQLQHAEADRERMNGSGASPTVDEARHLAEHIERLTRDLEAAEAELVDAEIKLVSVVRLAARQAADLAGIAPDTFTAYVSRGQAPPPDSPAGEPPWWHQATIDAWLKRRLGRVGRPGRVTARERCAYAGCDGAMKVVAGGIGYCSAEHVPAELRGTLR